MEKIVQEWYQNLVRKVPTEYSHDPVASEHLEVQHEPLEVGVKPGQFLADELIEDEVTQVIFRHSIMKQG